MELPPGTAAYSDRNPPPQNRQVLAILSMILLLIMGAVWGSIALVNQIVWWIPPQVEQQLGRVMVPIFEQQAIASETQAELNRLLDGLEQHLPSPLAERSYRVLYLPDTTVNALALPGDHIVIHQGLLQAVQSENELMMVLGHELGHFAHRDHLRGLGQALLIQLAAGAIFGDVGTISAIAGSGVTALSEAQFSQAQEQQADEFGLALLQQHYGHVGGATDFFKRVQQQQGDYTDWLASHPTPAKRVKALEGLIQQRGYAIQPTIPLPPAL